jgi:hypothetical protein
MSALGELLELLHDAHDGLSTFEVQYQDWGRPAPSNKLTVSYSETGTPQLRWQGAGPWPTDALSTRRIWMRPPDNVRVEISAADELIRLAVRDGLQWWRWDNRQGVTNGSATLTPRGFTRLPSLLAAPMIDVRQLMTTVRFEPAGSGERAGRKVIQARGRPRVVPPGRGPLSYEFEFDAEHGSLLRRAEFEDGECVWERRAVEVLYDAQIRGECFVFEAPRESR